MGLERIKKMSDLFEQAVSYIKAGDLENGKKMLIQVLQQNPKDENAWLWMSRCVPTIEQKKECFKRALSINPNNEMARKAMEKLSSPTSPTQVPDNLPPKQTTSPTSSPTHRTVKQTTQPQPIARNSDTVNNRAPKKQKAPSSKLWLPIILALIGCCGTVIAAFVGSDAIKQIVTVIIPRPDNFTISVHVADKSGSTIPGAKVLFFYPAGSLSQYSDSNGVSTFNVSNAGQGNLRVIVETDQYQIFEKQVVYPLETTIDVRLSEKQGSNKNVILRAVTDGSSAPIAGINIVVALNGDIYRQTTDSDGFALFELPFPSEGEVNTQISVNTKGYDVENQFSTLTPGKLQYILLNPNSLRIEVPNISTSISSIPVSPTASTSGITDGVIGSGVVLSQQAGGKGIKIIMLTPDSKPWSDAYLDVYEQKDDATGKPSQGNKAGYGNINLQGELLLSDLKDGLYLICPPNLGYGWGKNGCVDNVRIAAGSQAVVNLQPGKIEVTIVDASGTPWKDVYAEVHTQKQNAVGKPVMDSRVWYGKTDNTGAFNVWLTPGLYAVKIDLLGYNWGNLADAYGKASVAVNRGVTTPVLINMGQISIGLKDSSGSAQSDVYLEIYTQKNDVNGNPVLDARIWYGRTDNGGLITISLTEGKYALKNGDSILYNIPVEWGILTRTDGKTYQQIK
jgi:hypothetical protein